MRWLLALVLTVVSTGAHANGRFPGTSTIAFRPGSTQDIAVGVTFGLVLSHDGGTTWQWMCESAVGYGGVYDPLYVYRASGKLLATTYGGLRDSRDGCTFVETQLAGIYVPQLALAGTGLLAAASDPTDSRVYRSTDDGMTFSVAASPGVAGDQWDSLVVAPSDPMRVYLAGHHTDGGTTTLLLFQSTNGGDTFTPLPLTGLTTTNSSRLVIAGVSASNPDDVYLRVTFEYGNSGEGIYTIDASTGTSWTRIFDDLNQYAFLVRASGELVVASLTGGAQHSTNNGASWEPLAAAPHISCLLERSGVVWACTQNYSSMSIMGDGFGVMTTSDLVTWTGVMRYQDLVAPVDCAAGTPQRDECQDQMWCPLRMQIGITSEEIPCGVLTDMTVLAPKSGGCCDSSGGLAPASLLVLGWLCASRRRALRKRR